jgi:hypothetical protein
MCCFDREARGSSEKSPRQISSRPSVAEIHPGWNLGKRSQNDWPPVLTCLQTAECFERFSERVGESPFLWDTEFRSIR